MPQNSLKWKFGTIEGCDDVGDLSKASTSNFAWQHFNGYSGTEWLQKPPIASNDVRPITVEGDRALCDGYGVLNEVSSKEEMEHIIRAVVQPLMKRIRVEWMARMPQEGVPPSKTQGVVRTSFTVMSDGSIKDVVITQPSAIATFNDVAKAAILASHHPRRLLTDPATEAFPADVHRESLQIRLEFLYNLKCPASS